MSYYPGSCIAVETASVGVTRSVREDEDHDRSGGLHHVGSSCYVIALTTCYPWLLFAAVCAPLRKRSCTRCWWWEKDRL